MVAFSMLPAVSVGRESLIQSLLLLVLLFPTLYLFSFRPLVQHIRERDRAEESMRESEHKYRELFDNLGEAAFLTVVETGRILDTNKQGELLLGVPRSQIMGMNQSNLFPPERREEHRKRVEAYVTTKSTTHYESVVVRKDGRAVLVQISGVPITLYGKKLVIELFRDVSPCGCSDCQSPNQ